MIFFLVAFLSGFLFAQFGVGNNFKMFLKEVAYAHQGCIF